MAHSVKAASSPGSSSGTFPSCSHSADGPASDPNSPSGSPCSSPRSASSLLSLSPASSGSLSAFSRGGASQKGKPAEEQVPCSSWLPRCVFVRSLWVFVAVLAVSAVGGMLGAHLLGREVGALRRAAQNTLGLKHSMTGDVIYLSKGDDATTAYEAYYNMHITPDTPKPKAAIIILSRDEDVAGVVRSMIDLEKRFNRKYNYPYVFLNNHEFSEDFKSLTSVVTKARTLYGTIPEDEWSYPGWVSKERAAAARVQMGKKGVLYGKLESYHHMCRYFSGFFHKHPLLAEFDYYWRVEPDVHFYCDMDYDPFLLLQEKGIKYGFVITVLEGAITIPSLWTTIQDFKRDNADIIPKDNLMEFVTRPDGSYNLCHFWSNFEIGDLNFFRSAEYQRYFDHLDRTGNFYYERWGDAPVHSLAAVMLLNASQVHHFSDIGYRHNSMMNCPARMRNVCDCDATNSVDYHNPLNSFGKCHQLWDKVIAGKGGGYGAQRQLQQRLSVSGI